MKTQIRGNSINIVIVVFFITLIGSNVNAAAEEPSWFERAKEVIQTSYNRYFDPVPKCSDESVLSLVHVLYGKMRTSAIESAGWDNVLLTAAGFPKSIVRIELPHSTRYDSAIKLRSCSANAIFTVNKMFSKDQKEISVNISYSVQLNEQNNEEFFVILEPDFILTLNKRILGIKRYSPLK